MLQKSTRVKLAFYILQRFFTYYEGELSALAGPTPWGSDGDQLNRPQCIHCPKLAHPKDGAAEKQFFGLPFDASS